MRLDEWQTAAISAAVSSRFRIVNGGAGTGKTTIVRRIADKLESRGEPVELVAFAGKAAARLREATGRDAQTIHRLLGYKGEGHGFTVKSLSSKSVVVDESSMIPSSLLYEIVKRNPARLVLVGDEAQLPPVGNGQPFHDAIRFLPSAVSTLETCYRNREAIFSAAYAVRRGETPSGDSTSENERYSFSAAATPQASHAAVLDAVKSGMIDFSQDVILACRNGESATDPATVAALNADIKAIVNPSGDRLAPGDRVINTKNNSALDVWNGTTGTVDAFDNAGAMYVNLDFPAISPSGARTSSVLIDRASVKHWRLAYAVTVHKAQGSQYRRVVFLCNSRDIYAGLLDRSMLYTAITRAKADCRIVGEYAALRRAVSLVSGKKTVLQTLFNGLE